MCASFILVVKVKVGDGKGNVCFFKTQVQSCHEIECICLTFYFEKGMEKIDCSRRVEKSWSSSSEMPSQGGKGLSNAKPLQSFCALTQASAARVRARPRIGFSP